MRWPTQRLNHGNTRVVKKFLLLPKSISEETRWLEIVKIKQTFKCYYDGCFWEDTEWLDI